MSRNSLSASALALSLVLCTGLGACGKDKKDSNAVDENEATVCESSDDCESGWVCLDGECASAGSGAIYADPASAVTPDKVKNEVDRINEKSQQRADEILEGL